MRILGIGGVTVDRVLAVPEMPKWDETIYVSGMTVQQGGMVATAMVAASRLGVQAEFIGGVGDDAEGDFVLRSFQREDVDAARVRVFPGGTTGGSTVLVHESTGRRTIIHHRGVQEGERLDIGDIDLAGVSAVHVDGLWPATAREVLERSRAAGIVTVMDPSSSVHVNLALELLPVVDYCIASLHYATALTAESRSSDAAAGLLGYGCRTAIVTDGERGCHVRTASEAFHVPSFPVVAVDTTGAGDTFHGAFIAGLMRRYTVGDALRFASAAAALQCTRLGGQEGIPSLEQTLCFLAARGFDL